MKNPLISASLDTRKLWAKFGVCRPSGLGWRYVGMSVTNLYQSVILFRYALPVSQCEKKIEKKTFIGTSKLPLLKIPFGVLVPVSIVEAKWSVDGGAFIHKLNRTSGIR